MLRIALIMATMLALSSCAVVRVDGFVHEPTQRMLNTFFWTSEKATLSDLITADMEDPVLVPDFTHILSSRYSSLPLRVITRENTAVVIEQVLLVATDTGETSLQPVGTSTKPKENAQGFWMDSITFPVQWSRDGFREAQELKLSVSWRWENSSDLQVSELALQRKTKRTIAWPT